MKIYAGSDHAGLHLKTMLIGLARELGHEVEDLGPASGERVDYPDFGAKVGRAVAADPGVVARRISASGTRSPADDFGAMTSIDRGADPGVGGPERKSTLMRSPGVSSLGKTARGMLIR